MIDSKLAPFARRALGTWRLPVTFAALVAALCTSSQAYAGDVAAASQLFDEAKLLLEAGQLEAACAKFEASYDSDPQLGALMNLADCLERDGRLASSFGRWGDAIDLASRKGDDRVDYARSRREAIAPLLSFITLNVIGEGADLVVYKGNARLSAGAYGSALPSNPGETVIQVVRGEDLLWETKVVLDRAQMRTVDVPLGEIAAKNPTTGKKRQTFGETRTDSGTEVEGFWSKLRVAGVIVTGVGVLGVGAGFGVGGLALSEKSTVDEECTLVGKDRFCTSTGKEAADRAKELATISTWTLVASGVVATVGITLIIAAPNDYAKLEERAYLVPWFGPDGGGASLQGTF